MVRASFIFVFPDCQLGPSSSETSFTITNMDASGKDEKPETPAIAAPWIEDSFPSSDLKTIQSVYETLSTIPSISSGAISNTLVGSLDVQVTFSQRNLLSKAKVKLAGAFAVSLDALKGVSGIRRVGFPVEVSPQVVAQQAGPTGLLASLRIVTEKEKKRRFVEISNEAGVLERVEVSDTHGDFYVDGEPFILANISVAC